jgi:hypothetical protein
MNPSQPSPAGRARSTKAVALLCAGGALAVVVALAMRSDAPGTGKPPVVPASQPAPQAPPVEQLQLVHAETFQVQRPFQHVWRRDQPWVQHGWILVLSGKEELLRPRQIKEPVLYVGAQTAERVNTAEGSGKVVVIVPGDFALASAPIFLGSIALPEELGPREIAAELDKAVAAGAAAPTAAAIEAATKPGQVFATDYELRLRAIDLVEQHSPAEKDLIAGWRAPRLR